MIKPHWIILPVCLGIACASIRPTVIEERVVTIPHVPNSFLRVEAKNGHISVIKKEGSDVRITAIFKAITDERLESARMHAQRVEGDTLVVNTDWPDRKGNEGVNFEIEISDVAGLEAHTQNDRISISNLSGGAILRTSNGRIEIYNQDGPVIAETSNGWIRADSLSGQAILRTSNGRIEIYNQDGPVIARTSNGWIRADRVTGSIVARTSNDRIEISNAHQSVNARTSNGQIDISLNDTAPGPVLARTSNSDITLEVGVGFVGKLSLLAGERAIIDEPLQEKKIDKTSGADLLDFGDGDDSNLETNGNIYLKSLNFED